MALGNLWFAAERSTIPRALDGSVVHREIRREKHRGIDDVYLLTFDNGTVIQVDEPVYREVDIGDSVRKSSWSRRIRISGREVSLTWSKDVAGMAISMPLIMLLLIAAALCPKRSRHDSAPTA